HKGYEPVVGIKELIELQRGRLPPGEVLQNDVVDPLIEHAANAVESQCGDRGIVDVVLLRVVDVGPAPTTPIRVDRATGFLEIRHNPLKGHFRELHTVDVLE